MNVSVSPVRGEIMSIYLFPNCFLLQPISCSHPFLHSSFVLSACSSLVVVEAIIPDSNSSFNSLDNIFLLSAQLVASMFNLLAGNFQHVQLATALVQLRTGARIGWNQAAVAQHSTALDAQPLFSSTPAPRLGSRITTRLGVSAPGIALSAVAS